MFTHTHPQCLVYLAQWCIAAQHALSNTLAAALTQELPLPLDQDDPLLWANKNTLTSFTTHKHILPPFLLQGIGHILPHKHVHTLCCILLQMYPTHEARLTARQDQSTAPLWF